MVKFNNLFPADVEKIGSALQSEFPVVLRVEETKCQSKCIS